MSVQSFHTEIGLSTSARGLIDFRFFFSRFFFIWILLKVFIEFVTILFLFYALEFWPRGMWDISFLIRDQIHISFIWRWSFNHWTTREVPQHWVSKYIFPCHLKLQNSFFTFTWKFIVSSSIVLFIETSVYNKIKF